MRGSMNDQLRAVKASGVTWPTAVELLGKYTADELDERGQNGGFRLITDVLWRADLTIPELPGGWMAIYAGRQEKGATGSIFLMPNTPWTRKLWNQGQFKVLLDDGMNEHEAMLFMVSKERHKTRAIKNIIHLLRRHPEECRKRTLLTPRFGFGTRDDFDRWCSRHLPPGSYSMERVETILSVMRDIYHPSSSLKDEVQKLEAALVAEPEASSAADEPEVPKEEPKKKKKPVSAARRAKWVRYRERVRDRQKERRSKKGEAVGNIGDSAAADPVNDLLVRNDEPAVDPLVEELRQAMDARDAAQPETLTEEDPQ